MRNIRLRNGILSLICAIQLLSAPKAIEASASEPRDVTIPFAQPNGAIRQLQALEIVPADTGKYPLVVISHGSPRKPADRPLMSPERYLRIATWFAGHGFAVVVPMRRGYGKSDGPWAEGYGTCQAPQYDRAGLESAQDIQAVVSYMRGQSFVDPRRIVLVGVSAGAWGSLAAASQNPPGVAAVIAFAPGRGSYAPDAVCGSGALVSAAGGFGSTARIPLLWISAENDHFFGPTLAKAMFDAFHSASQAPAEFVAAPDCGWDGHMLFTNCPNQWHDAVDAFLQRTVGR